jgi:protein TonB
VDFVEYERNPSKKWIGIVAVILLHVLVIYALVSGLARKVVEVVSQPVEARIIAEVSVPVAPEQPASPPPVKPLTPPPLAPLPEIQVPQPLPQNAITAPAEVNPAPPAPTIQAVEVSLRTPVRIPAVVDARVCEKPSYPRRALENNEQGTVVLAFLIGIDGNVVDSRIEKSSGHKQLDQAAVAGLSLCKFRPGTVDGKPEESWTKIQYVWKLE